MEDFSNKVDFIKTHVLDSIERYIIGDLSVLDEIQPNELGLNACAVPTAMLILSTIEFIGYLVKENGKVGDTEANISAAFDHNNYFPDIYKMKSKIITIVYRHGMMHSALPKHLFENAYYALCKNESVDLFITHSVGSYVFNSLNVNVLSSDFQSFFKKFKNEIENTSDSTLVNRIYDKFSKSKNNIDDEFLQSMLTPQTTRPIVNVSNRP